MRSVQLKTGTLLLMSAFLLAGCLNDDENGPSEGPKVGQITPTGIEGLTYQTASQRGTTNELGEYRYYPGEEITLWVGDLQLVSGVPVEPVVTPLEFFTDERESLKIAGTTAEGLQSHRITEQQLVQTSDRVINLTRFLLAVNWRLRTSDGQGVDIRDRVIEQINATLPLLSDPIDFDVPRAVFALDDGDDLSPANQLLAEICFYPPDDELCEDPPTQEEIDNAPPRPEDAEDRDEDIDYKEDKESRRNRILKSIRTIGDIKVTTAENFLTRELDITSTNLAIRYYLDEYVADYPESDTAIKTVEVKKVAGAPSLANIEAISTRDQDIIVHSFGWQSASVDYFVSGEAGGEAEVLVNFSPDDTYRWIKKSLRVIITP